MSVLPHFSKLSLKNHAGDAVGVTLSADGESTCRLACPAGPVHVLASNSQPVILGTSVSGGMQVLQTVDGVSLSCLGGGSITMNSVTDLVASGTVTAASLVYGSTDVGTAISSASSAAAAAATAATSAQASADAASSTATGAASAVSALSGRCDSLEARIAYLESQFA